MNKQKSHTTEKRSSDHKADSTRDGFEPIPATSKVAGASGGNEPGGRTAVEVMDYYTAEEMHEHTEEEDNSAKVPATSEENVFNPVLDSVSEVTEK